MIDDVIKYIFDNLSDEELGYCDDFLIENIICKHLFETDTIEVRDTILNEIKFYLFVRKEEINIQK